MSLASVSLRIVPIGEDVVFGIVEQGGDLGKARAELVGNVAPGFSGGLAIGLNEDLPDGGRDDRLLALGHRGQERSPKMHDPNAIDRIHFTATLAFSWPHLAKPRRRRA
jgi:hypothetical protein